MESLVYNLWERGQSVESLLTIWRGIDPRDDEDGEVIGLIMGEVMGVGIEKRPLPCTFCWGASPAVKPLRDGHEGTSP